MIELYCKEGLFTPYLVSCSMDRFTILCELLQVELERS